MFRYINYLIFVSFFCSVVNCAGKPPILEYSIAKVAIAHAQKADAEKNATSLWIKAKELYYKGELAFSGRNYTAAERFFSASIKLAEKAEFSSIIKETKGEGIE